MKTTHRLLPVLQPKRHPEFTCPEEAARKRCLDCAHYDRCLDIADKAGWSSFACTGCPGYQRPEPLAAKRDLHGHLEVLNSILNGTPSPATLDELAEERIAACTPRVLLDRAA